MENYIEVNGQKYEVEDMVLTSTDEELSIRGHAYNFYGDEVVFRIRLE